MVWATRPYHGLVPAGDGPVCLQVFLSPGFPVDELVDEEELFVMLKFYMDESGLGKNRDEKICCVAGFVALNSNWKKFQKHWRSLLNEYGLNEFHSKEFWARKADGGMSGKYSEWSFADANRFMIRAVDLIHDYRLYLLGSAISLADFFSYSVEDRKFLTGARLDLGRQKFLTTGKPDAAYFVPFQAVVQQGTIIARDRREVAHFIFDEQNEFSPLALQRIAQLRVSPNGVGLREFLGDAEFTSSARILPLQVADLAAFTCKEYYKRAMCGLPIDYAERAVISPMEVLGKLLRKGNHSLFDLQKKQLDMLLKAMKELPPQV